MVNGMSQLDLQTILEAFRKTRKPKKQTKKVHNDEVADWTALKPGDVVRSIRGHGPHFVNYYGQKVYQGEYGYYEIESVDYNGLHVYEYSPRGKALYHGGRRFIYMGETQKVDIINREPHKLILVKK